MKQIQMKLPHEMRSEIDRARGDVSLTRWIRQAAEAYLEHGYGWQLPLASLTRDGEEYARMWILLPDDLVEQLEQKAAGQPISKHKHSMAGYVRRIIVWRLAREQDTGLILRNQSKGGAS